MQTTPEQKRILVALAILLSIGGVAVVVLARTLLSTNFSIFASPTPIPRPNYTQILEANGFLFYENDGAGDPMYMASCGCLVSVKADHVGFGAKYKPGVDCPMQELGIIINAMYPSEVLEFIANNLNAVIVEETPVEGKAVGFDIAMIYHNSIVTVIIKDPH